MMSWPGWAGSLCSKYVGRSSLVIGSVATLLCTNILLLEQRACWLRGGEDRFDDEGVQLIVGLVLGCRRSPHIWMCGPSRV